MHLWRNLNQTNAKLFGKTTLADDQLFCQLVPLLRVQGPAVNNMKIRNHVHTCDEVQKLVVRPSSTTEANLNINVLMLQLKE